MLARYSCQQTSPRPGCVRTLSTASFPCNPRARLPCVSSLRLEISMNRCESPRASQRRATQSTRHPALGWAVRALQSARGAFAPDPTSSRPQPCLAASCQRPSTIDRRPSRVSRRWCPTVVPDRAVSLGRTSKPASVAVDSENYGKHAPKA
jgi:hypothetical protein